MKIVTAVEMREIDRLTTEQYGVPSLTLMENAGTAAADFARKHFDFGSVAVICGKGNNGGDGLVAARKLKEAGKQVSVIVLAEGSGALRGDAQVMLNKLPVQPLWVSDEAGLLNAEIQHTLQAELILDAVLGTGFKPPLRGFAAKAVEAINSLRGWVLSVDLPSGADADSVVTAERNAAFVHADAIVSFTAPKPALVFSQLTDGPIAIAEIGSPSKLVSMYGQLEALIHTEGASGLFDKAAEVGQATTGFEHAKSGMDVIVSSDVQALSVPRRADANKGNFGHVLVIGGSVGKSGAAAMAGMAALRAGAGLVTVACPKSVQPTVAAIAPELMTEPLPETDKGTVSLLALARREELLQGKTVVVIGPGLSRVPETAEFIRDWVGFCPVSVIVDADALNAFAGQPADLQSGDDGQLPSCVLTPHPGEMSRLMGWSIADIQNNRLSAARRAAALTGACVVLKGHNTVIASPQGHIWINPTGNPGMAKGGSGDVLSGIVAAILAQSPPGSGMSSFKAGHRIAEPRDLTATEKVRESQHAKDHKEKETLGANLQEKVKQASALLTALYVAKGVYLHGLAGDIAASMYGENSMIATDIINCLGEAFAISEEEATGKFVYLQR
jgi:ADP-dependent NAD(P)H-hydrate dehydratase / NAD(P)H-hydrate epimerase